MGFAKPLFLLILQFILNILHYVHRIFLRQIIVYCVTGYVFVIKWQIWHFVLCLVCAGMNESECGRVTFVLCWGIRICEMEPFNDGNWYVLVKSIVTTNLYTSDSCYTVRQAQQNSVLPSSIPVLKLWFFTLSAKLGLIRIRGKILPDSSLSCGHKLTLKHCSIHIHTVQYSYIQYAFSTSYVNFKNSTENLYIYIT